MFNNEPLREESLLWTMRNVSVRCINKMIFTIFFKVFISPHVSGISRSKDIAQQFKENLERYEKNLSIPGTVDFSKGY